MTMTQDWTPEWTNYKVRLYEELERKPYAERTEEERQFCNSMYHIEEYIYGHDGDRE